MIVSKLWLTKTDDYKPPPCSKINLETGLRTESSELFLASYDGLKVQGNASACIKVDHSKQVGEVLKLANEFQVPLPPRVLVPV